LSLVRHTAILNVVFCARFARYNFAEKSRNSSRSRMKILLWVHDGIP
jgi:hypothetical protein